MEETVITGLTIFFVLLAVLFILVRFIITDDEGGE